MDTKKKERKERDRADYELGQKLGPKNEWSRPLRIFVWEKVKEPGSIWDADRLIADSVGGDNSHVKLGAKNHKGVIRYFDRKDRKKAEAFART